jgi:hypothetical protein
LRDHGNPIPHTDLIKAITQAHRYLYEIEQEANSLKFVERVGLRAIKPRCTLVFGRSADWDDDERRAYRILNGGYHSLSVLTYCAGTARGGEEGRKPGRELRGGYQLSYVGKGRSEGVAPDSDRRWRVRRGAYHALARAQAAVWQSPRQRS